MTARPSESDRLRRCEPAFGQLNRPMEPTSEPQWHDQTPMLIRMNCDPHAMPQGRPMAGRHRAGQRTHRSLTLGSPSRSPGLARGALERLREVNPGPGEAREGPPCAEVRPVPSAPTRVKVGGATLTLVMASSHVVTTTTSAAVARHCGCNADHAAFAACPPCAPTAHAVAG